MTEIDVAHQISAAQRTVGNRTIEAGEAHVVSISQTYATDQDDLWDAVTNIERIPRWLMPISGELKLGGSYQLQDHASGTILTCDPPKNFTATWEYGGHVSWIDVNVTSEGPDRSRVQVEHIAQADDETWRQFGPGAVGMGWDSMLLGLAIHIATGETVDPSFGPQWLATEDGRRFLSLSAQQWSSADVASGADANAARASSDRCLAAYLGEG